VRNTGVAARRARIYIAVPHDDYARLLKRIVIGQDRIVELLEKIAEGQTAPALEPPSAGRRMSVTDTAERLGVAPAKVRRWISTGQLTATNVSDSAKPRFLITEADLAAFQLLRRVESQKVQPARRRRQIVKRPDDLY
jgi:hypothetical protein